MSTILVKLLGDDTGKGKVSYTLGCNKPEHKY